MNKINPEKLLHSKWTAVQPQNRERHFIVNKILRAHDKAITGCELEAILNKKIYSIDWKLLRDSSKWKMGWERGNAQ